MSILIRKHFAISIAFGLAKEDKGVAAFAGFIGYYTFLVASSCMISTGIMDFSAMKISNILGVDTVDMGALAGIMAGLVTAKLHNKYHKVQFPAAIAFYGGKRFVALVVLVSMTVIGLVMPLIWAPISVGIDGLGRIIRSSGAFGVFIFGTLERLLIPTGLHHVLNSLFRTTAIGGTYHGVEGCLNIFLQFLDQAPLSDMKPYTQFLGQGKMPYMLFGLPAAALAIYRTTPQDKKAKVKALMIAGVAACFVSGITEPLEFSFMFIAPALFVFHAIMGGISFMLMSLLGVIVGNTGGGFIDFLLWGVFQPGSHWYWVIVVGIPYAFIYYFVFKWYLSRKKIVVSVSDDDDSDAKSDEKTNEGKKSGSNKTALQVIAGLGGMANIVVVNNCISRLRVDVKDMSLIDEETIVSYDLNYRPSMWSAIGGQAKAQEVNKEIAKYVDVMIGNEEDFTACLGFEIEGNDANLKELNLDGYKKMINEAAKAYPNFKAVATTLRTVKTATVNDWSAICWADGEVYKAKDYNGLEIMDRVGGGDSFASGLIYGLMTTEDAETAVNYGAAHGALAMTTPGDTTMVSVNEVEAIMSGAGARVQR